MRIEYLIPFIAYLLGSIPFGYILVKSTEGKDIRSFGSGNIGATNVFRRSRLGGILTLLLDAGKGYLAVILAGWLGGDIAWQAAAAVFAIIGHVFTIWLRFKGGKGVATGCGGYLALSPLALLTTIGLFVLILLLSRYISVASIGATAAFPILAYLYGEPASLLLGAAIGAVFIIVKHQQNIKRLFSGTENRFVLGARS
ncbi:MAG: glycerol-3-phosphate 1-O-acyltransferase PlsY [Acidobacteria bacterium]|nr:glycerol-3-phosphate 1-O-acyltransferase PlsY [Acidobacteriota bacterium]